MRLRLVVLAAGASARLGTCKALVDLGGQSPLQRLLDAGRALDAHPLVVGGADHDAIARAAPAHAEVIRNADWSAGRSGGIVLAAAARPGCDLCLAPVDVPLVPAEVFDALADAWSRAGEPACGWAAPYVRVDGGERAHGHPIVIGRDLAALLATFGKDVPLRALRARADPVLSIQVDSTAILDDLDDLEDLAALRRRIS